MFDGSSLTQLGVAGFFIACLITTVIYQNKQLGQKDQKIDSLQQSRLEDAKHVRDTISDPLDMLAKQMSLIYDKLIISKRGK